MKQFLFNGRNYKVINGLVYEHAGGIEGMSLCYRGDNVMLDAHCDVIGVEIQPRLKAKGDKPNIAEMATTAYTTQWIPSHPDKASIQVADFSKYGAGRLVKLWNRDDHGPENIGTFFIPKGYKIEDIERYAQEWYQGKSYMVPFEVWIQDKWNVIGVIEVHIPAIYV